jgi:glutathione peroxidase
MAGLFYKLTSMALTLRQKAMKIVYPLLLWAGKKASKEKLLINSEHVLPPTSFYTLSVVLSNGTALSFEQLKGKKVMLVNTASDCGYTPQYTELQQLYQLAKEELVIIAFPANDFKEQEKGSDAEISSFCTINFGVTFPIAKKALVIKSPAQHPVFQWLTNKKLNGWNDKAPSWNFSKYLVDEKGTLTHYFEPAVSPLSEEVTAAVNTK